MEKSRAEVTDRIRNAIKQKLIEMDVFVDDELPEYIMILIANKRSKMHIEKDLALFLKDDAAEFSSWLFGLLNSLKSSASQPPQKNSEKRPHVEFDDGDVLALNPQEFENDLLAEDNNSNGETQKKSQYTSKAQPRRIESLKELATQSNSSPKFVKVYPVQHYEAPLSSVVTQPRRPAQDEYDPTNPAVNSMASTIRAPERRYSVPAALQANKLLRRAMDDATKSVGELRSVRSKNERYQPTPIGVLSSPDVNYESTQTVENVPNNESTMPIDMGHMPIKLEYIEDVNQDLVTVEYAGSVYPNVGLQQQSYQPIVGLQQSASHQPTVGIARSAATFQSNANVARSATTDQPNVSIARSTATFQPIVRSATFQPNVSVARSAATFLPNVSIARSIPTPRTSTPKANADTSQDSTYFFVTLEGYKAPKRKRTVCSDGLDDDYFFDDDELEADSLLADDSFITDNYSNDDDEENYTPDVRDYRDLNKIKRQKIIEKCRFWPSCKSGDDCHYHHPTSMCKKFPNCTYGGNCIFIHPNCKFDALCSKKSCPYTHMSKRKVPFGRPKTPVKSQKTKCRFFPNCTARNCPFIHPRLCWFGRDCQSSSCQFSHLNLPSRKALQWQA